jgi:hypothetical protein
MFEFGFSLGFLIALAIIGGLCRLAGARRLARVFGALAGRDHSKAKHGPPVTPVQEDVIQALVSIKAAPGAARRATLAAAVDTPPSFEPLFRRALALLKQAA